MQRAILEFAPDQFHDMLGGYSYTVKSQQDLSQWQQELFAAVIASAERTQPPPENLWVERRAACPLCRSKGSHWEGWKLPDGLERHLYGTNNTVKCSVIRAAYDLMRARHRQRLDAAYAVK